MASLPQEVTYRIVRVNPSESLSPEEMDRMRHYHASRLKVSAEYLAELGVGEDRWTRKDLEAVDAFNAEEAERAAKRRRVFHACVALASFVVGSGLGWVLVRVVGL